MLLKRSFIVLLFVSLIFISFKPEADDTKAKVYGDENWSEEFLSIEVQEPRFLNVDDVFSIPEPPSNTSAETQEELVILKQYAQELRTDEQVQKIIQEQKGSTDLKFGLGEDLPQEFLDEIMNVRYLVTADANHFIYEHKRYYNRARPTQLDPSISLVIPVPQNPAYPSGHAAIAWLGGRFYSYIDPKNIFSYMRYAGDVGMRRSISGIHYPSDSVAGRILADQIFDALLEKPGFRKEIDRVKAEYESVSGAVFRDNYDNIEFLEADWNPDFLSVIEKGPSYLDATLDFEVPPPPSNTSPETLRELTLLREYAQTYRSDDVIQKIIAENVGSSELLEGGLIVEPFYSNIAFSSLWADAYAEITYFLMRDKQKFARPRPTQLAEDLTLVVDVPGHAAYPSGHAAHTRLLALIMGEIAPDNADVYLDMALSIGKRREIAGLHYPSDTRAGIQLADGVFNRLMQNSEFVERLDQARKEFVKVENLVIKQAK